MRQPKLASASLLQGLIFDRHDRRMGPAHTCRIGQRFRYYVTLAKLISDAAPGAYRIAADPIEQHCIALLTDHLAARATSIDEVNAAASNADAEARRRLLTQNVRRIVIGDAELKLGFDGGATISRSLKRIRHGNGAKVLVVAAAGDKQPTAAAVDHPSSRCCSG